MIAIQQPPPQYPPTGPNPMQHIMQILMKLIMMMMMQFRGGGGGLSSPYGNQGGYGQQNPSPFNFFGGGNSNFLV